MEPNAQNSAGKGGKILLILLALLTVASVFFSAYQLSKIIGEGGNSGSVPSGTKLVLYDGPKSLKTASEATKDLDPLTEAHIKPLAKSENTIIKVWGNELFVYETGVGASHTWDTQYKAPQDYTPITYFDFEGEAKIEIDVSKVKEIENIDKCTVSPLSRNIEPKVNGKKVTFTITKPGDYTVQFNNKPNNAIHIFANPIEMSKPDTTDENVKVIGPGEWNLDAIPLEDNQTLYISGGAVVHGTIGGNFVKDVKVIGRGIVDGSLYPSWEGREAKVPINFVKCTGFTLKDILFLNSNCWVVNSDGSTGGIIDNIKVISGRGNGDGITLQSSRDVTISNSFVRSWDDSLVIKNYNEINSNNIKFKDITVWTDLAQSMEIGYETNKGRAENSTITNISWENITVINNFHKPVISIHNSDDALVKDISYKNIVVENANMGEGDSKDNRELIHLYIGASGWSASGAKRGKIQNVTIENVNVLATNKSDVPSTIEGFNDEFTVDGVTIKNLVILGEKVTQDNHTDKKHPFFINKYSKNIVFE